MNGLSTFVLLLAAAYVAGSINFSILVFRITGRKDPRHRGSGNPGATNVYQLQMVRALGDADWTTAGDWTAAWEVQFPEAATLEGRWYRNDPRIVALLAENGYLGTGENHAEAFEVTR